MDIAKAEETKLQESQQDAGEPEESKSMGFEDDEDQSAISALNETDIDRDSISALNRTEDMELNKTDVIARMAFPSRLGTEDSQHFIADNLDESLTIDLQSKASTQLYRGGMSTNSKLSRAVGQMRPILKEGEKSGVSSNFINLVKNINQQLTDSKKRPFEYKSPIKVERMQQPNTSETKKEEVIDQDMNFYQLENMILNRKLSLLAKNRNTIKKNQNLVSQ